MKSPEEIQAYYELLKSNCRSAIMYITVESITIEDSIIHLQEIKETLSEIKAIEYVLEIKAPNTYRPRFIINEVE